MNFYEKPNLENIRKDRGYRAHLHNYYHSRFLVGTVAMILVIIICFFNSQKEPEIARPSSHDYEIANTLITIEGREVAINERYDTAKIIAESTFGKDIITVFEVGYMHSFCVFETLENGYWMEYCGSLFPKTDIVKGTVSLVDNSNEYDIYLQNDNTYTHLLIDRVNMTHPHNVQQEKIIFDKNGIALMKLDPEINDPAPRIVAYDTEGNHYILEDGTL